jgi:Ca-activated chloride channel family protein
VSTNDRHVAGNGRADRDPVLAEEALATAYALGELDGRERAAFEERLERSPELRAALAEIRAMAGGLEAALASEPELELTPAQRRAILVDPAAPIVSRPRWSRRLPVRGLALAATLAAAATILVTVALHYRSFAGDETAATFQYDLAGRGSLEGLGYLGDEESSGLGALGYSGGSDFGAAAPASRAPGSLSASGELGPGFDTEAYTHLAENGFRSVASSPLSTFSIDVDTASYANVRRFLTEDRLPPPDAVRIEELVNYFRYDYPAPTGSDPFSVSVEVASAPWKSEHRLVRIGLRGRDVTFERRRPTNLVFLLDVSGSMVSANKLPLVKKSLRLLVDQLDERDHVAIAVYAGAAGAVLPPTSGDSKGEILGAMERLSAGGSTNGGEGLVLAYRMARENLDREGVNRVVLCTDGDFNVGTSSEGELVRLVEREAESGVALSVLGFGTGNLKDSQMEQLADHGDGNYAYVDRLSEARKVLVEQMGGTLVTIAEDVKVQVEFNPLEASAYRLIGYENRLLASEDFNDDRVDAGEIGAGHTVTALYEVVPARLESERRGVDPLKYQDATRPSAAAGRGELLTVKLRYQDPGGSPSRLIEVPVRDGGATFAQASEDTRFAAAVAGFGMVLRGSEHASGLFLREVRRWAAESLGPDPGGYRTEFLVLVARAMGLTEAPDERVIEHLGYLGDDER